MSGWDAFHALTTAGIPLSQSVIVRCTTWPEPDADEDADAAVDVDEDDPELQAASATATGVRGPAGPTPRFENGLLTVVFSLDRRSGSGIGRSPLIAGMRFPGCGRLDLGMRQRAG